MTASQLVLLGALAAFAVTAAVYAVVLIGVIFGILPYSLLTE